MDLSPLTQPETLKALGLTLAAAAKFIAAGAAGVAVKDGYEAVKKRLRSAFGKKEDIENALQQIERKPDSPHPPAMLADELKPTTAAQDAELLRLAQSLADLLKQQGQLPPTFSITQAGSGAIAVGQGNVVGGQGSLVIGSVEQLTIQSSAFPPAPSDQASPRAILWTYLNQVICDTAFLDLSGVDKKAATDNQETRLQLAAIYTDLDTVRRETVTKPMKPDLGASHYEVGFERDTRESVTAFASRTPCAVLLGDPGSGKTTFANFLALALAGELLGDATANLKLLGESWQAGPLLPLRVVLRDFAAQVESHSHHGPGEQLLQHFARRLGEGLVAFAPLLRKHLLEHGGLLILDGLDEVPEAHHRREFVKRAVLDLQRSFPRLRFLLTSRTYAYQRQEWRLPGFTETVLAPFSDEQVKTFVEHWYAHICTVRRSLTPEAAQGRAALLKQAIAQNPYLRDLARRPLLLTLMASLHAWRGGTLPDQREELYDESVNLLLDFWEKPKIVLGSEGQPLLQVESAAEWFNAPRQRIREALEEVAFQVHHAQPDRTGAADIREADLVGGLLKVTSQTNPDLKQTRVIEYIRDRAGLLLNRAEGIYSFPHRTFQEYLAARHLTLAGFPDKLVELAKKDVERWREVVLLAGAKAARGAHHSAWSLVAALCPDGCEPPQVKQAADRDWAMAMLAGQVVIETGIARVPELGKANQNCLAHVRAWLTELVSGGHLPPVDRAAAGVVLGRLGDRRKGVGLADTGLPDIDWITIPEGKFWMGDKERYCGERRIECGLITKSYRISRYSVTVAQYQAFEDDKGYATEQWWGKAKAAGYWKEGKLKSLDGNTGREEWREGPGDSGGTFRCPNHPVVDINWFEAVAFCRWLTANLNEGSSRREESLSSEKDGASLPRLPQGEEIRLPSEAQWERAARGTDGRTYPWGNQSEVAQRCNTGETGIGHTSPVGIFPNGHAACGAADMAGNVWEWCRTIWRSDYADYEKNADGRLDGESARVLRGGAFDDDANGVRGAYRYGLHPHARYRLLGFRLVASPFVPGR